MEDQAVKERFLSAVHRFGKLKMHLVFHSSDLSKGEFFCLGMIEAQRKHSPESPCFGVSELAERMHVHSSALSRMLRGMEERGLIQRSICPEDRRNTQVQITEEGDRVWQQAAERMDVFADRIVQRMGASDMMQLVELLDRVSSIIEEEQEAKEC